MARYHIDKNGRPALCRAAKGNCPLGGPSGSDNHFDTPEDAQAAIDRQNASNWTEPWSSPAQLASTDTSKTVDMGYSPYEREVDNIYEIDQREDLEEPVTLSNGDTYTGVRYTLEGDSGMPEITLMKDKEDLSKGFLQVYPKHPTEIHHNCFVFDRNKLGKDTETVMGAVFNPRLFRNLDTDEPYVYSKNAVGYMFDEAGISDEERMQFEDEYGYNSSFDEEERERIENQEGYENKVEKLEEQERKDLEDEYHNNLF